MQDFLLLIDIKMTIDNKYNIDIVRQISSGDLTTLYVTFSNLDCPDLSDYLAKKFFSKEPVLFTFDNFSQNVMVKSTVFCGGCKLADETRNEDINLFESACNPYGDIIYTIPLEKRKEFVENQAYGNITFSLCD